MTEMAELREVQTAGGLLFEQYLTDDGAVETYLWVVGNRESVQAHAADPSQPIEYQLPKGHTEPGEEHEPEITAGREIREELGFFATVEVLAGEFERPSWEYDKGQRAELVRKHVKMFVMKLLFDTRLPESERDNETSFFLRVDKELLDAMHHTEEAHFLANYFGVDWQPKLPVEAV